MTVNTVNDKLAEAESDSDYSGYLIGVVVDNVDPMGLSRIKVRIPDLFEPDHGPVPWIGPHKKSPFGIGANFGVYGSPAIGAKVRVKLQNNDPHYALYEADEYDKGVANAKFKSPKTWGFKDPGGSELFVNYETQQWEFTHSSGLSLKYDGNGNCTLTSPASITQDADLDMTLKAGGNIKLDAAGVTTTGNLAVGTGATGTFGTSTGQTVTVASGIITKIE